MGTDTGADVDQRTLAAVEAIIQRAFREHEAVDDARLRAAFDRFESEAFPDGAASHRHAHQELIEAARAEKDFWRQLRVEMAKKSILGILQILGILLLAGVAAQFGINTFGSK